MQSGSLRNLLVGQGFEFLDQLLQCRQTWKARGRTELQAVHGGDESGIASHLHQPMQPLESARRSLHPIGDSLLPVGIRNRTGIPAVARPPQDLGEDVHSERAAIFLNLDRQLGIDRAAHIDAKAADRLHGDSRRQRPRWQYR